MVFAAGYPAWKKVSGSASSATAAVSTGDDEAIDIKIFKEVISQSPDSIQLIDVRDKDEYDAGHFESAINIPTDDLEKNIKSLTDAKPIVFVCNTGAKSGEAYYMLQDLRPDLKKVQYLDAEVEYKKDGSFTIKKPE